MVKNSFFLKPLFCVVYSSFAFIVSGVRMIKHKMNTFLLVILIVAGVLLIVIFLNRKLTEIVEKQKPSDELLEYLN